VKVIIKKTNEIKEVADGYARNYLLPLGLAVVATKKEIDKLETKKLKEEKRKTEKQKQEEKKLKEVKNKTVRILRKVGRKGKLHGAVTVQDLAKELEVEKDQVLLEKPIKRAGEYEVELKIGGEKLKIKVIVEAEK
jgi:large subunit ribosomal protein L9